MKITVVGFLAVVGAIVLVAVIVHRLAGELEQRNRNSDGHANHLS